METVKENKSQSRPSQQRKSEAGPEKRKSSFDSFKNLGLDIHGVRLPKFQIQEDYLELIDSPEKVKNTYDFLIALCQKGFKKLDVKRGTEKHKKYVDRIY